MNNKRYSHCTDSCVDVVMASDFDAAIALLRRWVLVDGLPFKPVRGDTDAFLAALQSDAKVDG